MMSASPSANVSIDLDHTPLVAPPPGVTSNFVDPETLAPQVIAAATVVLFFSTTFLLARIWTRTYIVHHLAWEDYLCAIAWALAVTVTGLNLSLINIGVGRHVWDVPVSMFHTGLLTTWIQIILYLLCLLLIKLSILLLYRRISSQRRFRIATWVVMFVLVASTLGLIFAAIFSCNPIAKAWDRTIPGSCRPGMPLTYATGLVNIATDVMLLVLPLPVLWTIALPIRQKIGLCLILVTGSFVCVISILRLIFSRSTLDQPDFTYNAAKVIIWSLTELHVAICCSCMPVLKPFLRRYAHGLIEDTSFSNRGSRGGRSSNRRPVMVVESDAQGNIKMRDLNLKSKNKTLVSGEFEKISEGTDHKTSLREMDAESQENILPIHANTNSADMGGIMKTTEILVLDGLDKGRRGEV